VTTDTPKSRGAGCMPPILAVLLLAVALLLGGCDPESSGPHQPQPKPPAANHQAQPNNLQQPAPVRGDPSAHNTQPGQVGLFVSWESENNQTPLCEWSRNGASQPCANMQAKRDDDDGIGYWGFWEHEEAASAGMTYTVNAQGTGAVKYVTCEIAWKGHIYPGTPGEHRCGASLVLP
jgi:hypothetical protein